MAFRTHRTLGDVLKNYQLTSKTRPFPARVTVQPAPFQQLNKDHTPVYGTVSNGEIGEIDLLEASILCQYRDRFDINRLDECFGALTCVLETCKRIYNL